MSQQLKHHKFLQTGYDTFFDLKSKTLAKKEELTFKAKVIKHEFIGFSHFLYEDFSPVFKNIYQNIKKQYEKTPIPNYLSHTSDSFSELKNDIHLNPLSKKTEEQVKKIDKKHFIAIGISCFLLSSLSFTYQENQDETFKFSSLLNIHFDFSQPKDNPTNLIVESLQPQFMTPIFRSKLEAFTKLLGITEGEANFFYKDNLGIATAYGWNPTKNSKEFNIDLANSIGMSSSQIKTIEKISLNHSVQSVPKNLKKVVLTKKQVKQSAEYMLDFYENEFLKVMKIKAKKYNKDYEQMLKSYYELPNNQQAVMIHMAYKVGTPNLLKYDRFFNRLFTYMEQPTTINLEKVVRNFEYSYKTKKGEKLQDVRVQELHNEFFNKCSINEIEIKEAAAVKANINSCRKFVAAKTIQFNHKG